ncbi:MAG: aminoacetone oxidase family FAD-binding enzyme [candidate division Zixibacteria bacterium]|nr:aminoacetone oxidase family FAD-binding enzyme [candidate division Zixibacteria bacterium]
MSDYQIVVIGAGASGLMAAISAAEIGASVLLLEKKGAPARKLAITGKGRCNLTNIAPLDEFIRRFGSNGKFLRQTFMRYFTDDLLEFLRKLGVETIRERGGRIFPKSENANDVVDALISYAESKLVEINTNSIVSKLSVNAGKINGAFLRDGNYLPAKSVILATGGASYPATGSTGDGYRFAAEVGHNIIPIRPSLVPLEIEDESKKSLSGLHLRNVWGKLLINGHKKQHRFGEITFINTGLSGPTILTMSKTAVDALDQGREVSISIDLKPALDEKKLDARLLREFDQNGKKKFSTILKSLLPVKLIPFCITSVGINPDKEACRITAAERKRLRIWLKDMRLRVTGYRSFREAIITAGGVDLKEIDPRTMESRLIERLYFCGEVIDIDADTGGYNLQAAFSTGWLAGKSAAENILLESKSNI